MIVQCSSGHLSKDLVSCARHKAIDEFETFKESETWRNSYREKGRKIIILFIISLPKIPGGTEFVAFQGGNWLSLHIDDLRTPDKTALQFHSAVNTPLSELFYPGVGSVCLHKRLNRCIQSAVSDIQEITGCKSRKNKLLNLLLNIVPADGDPGALLSYIYVILYVRMSVCIYIRIYIYVLYVHINDV